jgi:competence protein ComEA
MIACVLSFSTALPVFAGNIVSFNKATAKEIMAIEDIEIPDEIAEAIVKYRNDHGTFKVPEDIQKVPGMTQDLIEELNPVLDDTGDVVFDPEAEPALAPSKC